MKKPARILPSFLVFLSACTGCAHLDGTRAQPLAEASFGVQCVLVRNVYCLIDNDFSANQCDRSVPPAINAINAAVGRQVLNFAGFLNNEQFEDHYKHGDYVVGVNTLPPNILGTTLPTTRTSTRDGRPCITNVITALSPDIFKSNWEGKEAQIATHELIHGLGFGHSEDSLFDSMMRPAISDPHAAPTITPEDTNSLRAVYNR